MLFSCLQTGGARSEPGGPHHAQCELGGGGAARGEGGAGGGGAELGPGKRQGAGARFGGRRRRQHERRETQELFRPAPVQHRGEPALQRRDRAGANHRAELRYAATRQRSPNKKKRYKFIFLCISSPNKTKWRSSDFKLNNELKKSL